MWPKVNSRRRINAKCNTRNSRFRFRTNRDREGGEEELVAKANVLSRTSIFRSSSPSRYLAVSCPIILRQSMRVATKGIARSWMPVMVKFERWCTFKVQICHGAGGRRTIEVGWRGARIGSGRGGRRGIGAQASSWTRDAGEKGWLRQKGG